jgi:hypothetical protein
VEGSGIHTARSQLAAHADAVTLWLVPALVLAATIVVPLGSSGVSSIHVWGGRARWVALLAFPLLELGVCLAAPRRWWRQLQPTWYHGVWIAFLAVAAVSTAWSVAPRATLERAVAIGIVAVAALGCIWRCTADQRFLPRLIWAFGLGMATVLVLSFVLGAFDPSVGRQSDIQPGKLVERWRGIFESPNELALQALLLVPLAAAIGLGSQSRRARNGALAAVGGGLLMILLSGTRSSLGIALLMIVVVGFFGRPRGQWVPIATLVASVAVAVGLGLAIGNGRTLSPAEVAKLQAGTQSTGPKLSPAEIAKLKALGRSAGRPLSPAEIAKLKALGEAAGPTLSPAEIAKLKALGKSAGRPLSPAEIAKLKALGRSSGHIPPPPTAAQRRNGSWLRSLSAKTFGGRTEAWSRADFEIGRRPVGGWGFATEQFVIGVFKRVADPSLDQSALAAVRTPGQPGPFTQFTGGYVENSYIGAVVQLGALGALLLALQLVPALVGAWAASRRRDPYQLAAAGLFITAVLIATVETFLWTAGNLATLATWAAGAVLVRRLLMDRVTAPDDAGAGRRIAPARL